MKKAKRYDDGGLYTGDDPIVKYRMGITDTPADTSSDDMSMDREPNPTPEPSATPTPTPTKKAVGKAIAKAAAAEEKPAPKAAPTKQQKAGPTMIRDSGTKSKSGMTGSQAKNILFGSSSNDSPRMRAAKRDQAMDASNYSMKSGGKVSSASKRADGIAQKGKTKGKWC